MIYSKEDYFYLHLIFDLKCTFSLRETKCFPYLDIFICYTISTLNMEKDKKFSSFFTVHLNPRIDPLNSLTWLIGCNLVYNRYTQQNKLNICFRCTIWFNTYNIFLLFRSYLWHTNEFFLKFPLWANFNDLTALSLLLTLPPTFRPTNPLDDLNLVLNPKPG